MKLATAKTRFEKKWKNVDVSWESIVKELSNPKVTNETVEQYKKYSKVMQDNIKDVGGFVGGHLKDGLRKNGCVLCRSLLSLDIDYGEPNTLSSLKEKIHYKALVYSTHKHTTEKPRYRLIIPLSREITEEEYEPVARMVAKSIDIELFDDSTYQANRLMYLPSVSKDGEFVFFEFKYDELLNPDDYLKMLTDWKDISSYPVSSRQSTLNNHQIKNVQDPTTKDGIIGAFCKTYSIQDVIDKFLPNIYKPSHIQGRYDYIPADSTAGVIIYDNKFLYSHHATDPAANKLLNAFDLCRIHLFGNVDHDVDANTPISKYPSYVKMTEMAVSDKKVKDLLFREREEKVREDFFDEDDDDDSWKSELQVAKNGKTLDTYDNLTLIFRNDKKLKNIRYNQFNNIIDINGKVPWTKAKPGFNDTDIAALKVYIEKTYNVYSPTKTIDALYKVAVDNGFHPVRDFLESLPAWDNEKRVDKLLVKYFNADDNEYTNEAMRKTLVAAIARVYKPGIKFDTVLILNGEQGIYKSTFFAKLGMQWFSDSLQLSEMKDKASAEKLQGYWILELGELAGMKKVDVETVKSFITRVDDKYRASYGRVVESHPRQCIIVGSTNNDAGFLRDITGNRRFWPVKVYGKKDINPTDMTKEEVEQIWAEAFVYYKKGEKLYLSKDAEKEALIQQEEALESDEREGIVKNYLDTLLPEKWDQMDLYERRLFLQENNPFTGKGTIKRETVSNIEIWCECFAKDQATIKQIDSYQIGGIMKKIRGWERTSDRSVVALYGRQRLYRRVDNVGDTD